MVSPAEWVAFEAELLAFNNEVGQQSVTWKHLSIALDRYQEDDATFVTRELLCLVSYNDIRVWPTGRETEPGLVDKEYCYLLINNTYLSGEGWLTANHNIAIDQNRDYFIINDIAYEYAGDTPAAQAGTKPIYSIVILKRKLTSTPGTTKP